VANSSSAQSSHSLLMALFTFALYRPILLSGLDSAHGKQMTQYTKEDDTYDLKTAKTRKNERNT